MSKRHVVRAGECIASIAFDHGFAPDTLWNHDDNRALREVRSSGNLLVPGDVVWVPVRRERMHMCPTGKRHRFRRNGVPEMLRLQLVDVDKPRADTAYVLDIDGVRTVGTTDSQGRLEHCIAPSAMRGTLTVDNEVYELRLGGVEPLSTTRGVRSRLRNLGFLDDTEELPDALDRALVGFQRYHGLPATGEADAVTLSALATAYGA